MVALRIAFLAVPIAAVCAAPLQDGVERTTVRYRGLDEIARTICDDADDRTVVVWLVERAVGATVNPERLGAAVERAFAKSPAKHAVIAMGDSPQLLLKATASAELAGQAIRSLSRLVPPTDELLNMLAHVREAAAYAASVDGTERRLVVLVAQENVDTEDDVEATVAALRKSRATLYAVVPEAVYSDAFWRASLNGTLNVGGMRWAQNGVPDRLNPMGAPRGRNPFDDPRYKNLKFKLTGAESAFIEFPFGWPFPLINRGHTIVIDPAQAVPSGFGAWAVNRIATETRGRTFLYNARRSSTSFCARWGCGVCAGTHRTCGAEYDEVKLGMTAPDIGSRAEALDRSARDPLAVAMIGTWMSLYRDRILRGAPPLSVAGAGLREFDGKNVPENPLAGTAWDAILGVAQRSIPRVDEAAAELERAIAKHQSATSRRSLATAEALLVHLKLLSCGYEQLAEFCKEMERVDKLRARPPESTSKFDSYAGQRVIGYTHWSATLCHGGAPLRSFRFLGDERVRAKLIEALELADRTIDAHRGTPWDMLVRRAHVPVFVPVYAPGPRRPPDRPSSDGKTQPTPQRPRRPNEAEEGGESGGTATGDD
jgi:hypothetical protein